MRERLGEARQTMNERFPLTEALWLDWISDALDVLDGPDDIPAIEELFSKAVKDYLSIELWVQYLE
jgi:hypothetical protein